jgi:hypothetical protein
MVDASSAQNKPPILLDTTPTPTHRVAASESTLLLSAAEPRKSELAAAWAAVRDRCITAFKDKKNPHHDYSYASAESMLTAVAEPLKESGLSLAMSAPQLKVVGSGNLAVYAMVRQVWLIHTSGESVYLGGLEWPVCPDRGRPIDKAYATAITTSLAYLLRDLFLIARVDPETDMDARDDRAAAETPAASTEPIQAAPSTPTPAPPPASSAEIITPAQYDDLAKLINDTGTDHQKFCTHYAIGGVSMLPAQHFNDARGKLLAKFKPTSEQCDKIDRLCADLKLDATAALRRLREFLPDAKDFASLTRVQAELVIEALAKSAAVQRAKTPKEKP